MELQNCGRMPEVPRSVEQAVKVAEVVEEARSMGRKVGTVLG